MKQKYYKIIKVSTGELAGLCNNPMSLEGYKIEKISKEEYARLRLQLIVKISS